MMAKSRSSAKSDHKPGKGGDSKAAQTKKGNANTPSHIYADTFNTHPDCVNDKNEVERKCKPETDDEKKKRQKGKGGLLGKLKLPAHSGKADRPGAQWINDHCEFLMIKPSSPEAMFRELQDIPGKLANELGVNALEAVKSEAQEKLKSAVEKKLAKMGLKQLVTRVGSFLAGPWVGIAVNIAMTADGANDIKNAIEEFPDLKRELEEAAKKLEDAQKKVADLQNELDKYKDPKSASGYNEQAMVSDMMHGAAEMNPCIQARRCALVPYNQTENPASSRGNGCCPGQSGHHLLPSAMFDGCDKYKESRAPTICVEGTNNAHGSHGLIHNKLGGILSKEFPGVPEGSPIPKNKAIDAGVESVGKAFPESKCDEKCLKAQLKAYYDNLKCTPKKNAGLPGSGKGSAGTGSTPPIG